MQDIPGKNSMKAMKINLKNKNKIQLNENFKEYI